MEKKFNGGCHRSPIDRNELKWSQICKDSNTYISKKKENVIHRIISKLFK